MSTWALNSVQLGWITSLDRQCSSFSFISYSFVESCSPRCSPEFSVVNFQISQSCLAVKGVANTCCARLNTTETSPSLKQKKHKDRGVIVRRHLILQWVIVALAPSPPEIEGDILPYASHAGELHTHVKCTARYFSCPGTFWTNCSPVVVVCAWHFVPSLVWAFWILRCLSHLHEKWMRVCDTVNVT